MNYGISNLFILFAYYIQPKPITVFQILEKGEKKKKRGKVYSVFSKFWITTGEFCYGNYYLISKTS